MQAAALTCSHNAVATGAEVSISQVMPEWQRKITVRALRKQQPRIIQLLGRYHRL
jgi:hypothetical protein